MSCHNLSPTQLAQQLLNEYSETGRLLLMHGNSIHVASWRRALCQLGIPVLELNGAPEQSAHAWLKEAKAFSEEFLSPVVVFGWGPGFEGLPLDETAMPFNLDTQVQDTDWVHTRQIALTQGVENSMLNQEFRREPSKRGWIRIGWHEDAQLVEGNGLLLAWSSPLPLMRIRNFAARCPQITLIAPDPEAMAREVGAQGISVSGWRFEVK